MMEAATKEIEYYDDEDLDRFAGREADAYTDEEVEEFSEVLHRCSQKKLPAGTEVSSFGALTFLTNSRTKSSVS